MIKSYFDKPYAPIRMLAPHLLLTWIFDQSVHGGQGTRIKLIIGKELVMYTINFSFEKGLYQIFVYVHV